jgi:hypothetical protein
MKNLLRSAVFFVLMILAVVTGAAPGGTSSPGVPSGAGTGLDPLQDYRYCGTPKRDKNGRILRRKDVLVKFAKLYACPSTLKHEYPCPGFGLDHSIPLANGGCDAVFNLTWIPNEHKRCAGTLCKDRWERDIYIHTP